PRRCWRLPRYSRRPSSRSRPLRLLSSGRARSLSPVALPQAEAAFLVVPSPFLVRVLPELAEPFLELRALLGVLTKLPLGDGQGLLVAVLACRRRLLLRRLLGRQRGGCLLRRRGGSLVRSWSCSLPAVGSFC